MATPTWTSHLGHKFPRELVDSLDTEHHKVLQRLRAEHANAHCAECGEGETAWASVNIGVFLCLRCADVHRALGTDISKVKGCAGTYLWGPDEIAQMQAVGNAAAEALYGGGCAEAKPAKEASKEERVELCRKKYEQRAWAPGSRRQKPAAAVYKGTESPAAAASANSRPGTPAARPPVRAAAGTPQAKAAASAGGAIDFQELFKEFDVPAGAQPVDVLHKSQWWAGSRPARASGTPASSTVASEADLDAFLEHCLSDPDLAAAPATAAAATRVRKAAAAATAPSAAPAAPAPPEESRPHVEAAGVNVWEDFGAW